MLKQNFSYGLCTYTEPDTAELAALVFYFAVSLFPSGRGDTCPESIGGHVAAEVESPPQPMLEK